MVKGKLFYDKADINRNKAYIKWIMEEGANQGLNIELAVLGQDMLEPCDFVINRSRNYELALKYELNGIPVYNNSKFTLVGNNKLAAYRFVQELGIPYGKIYLDELLENLPPKLIRKPNKGHGGQEVSLIQTRENGWKINQDSYLYQEYLENIIGDVRYYIINNKIIHSIIRTPQKGQVVSNFSRGGNISIYHPSKKEVDGVETILANIHIDFGGIDFLVGSDGSYRFNEFEDVVGSRMLSALGINDTTYRYIKHIKNTVIY